MDKLSFKVIEVLNKMLQRNVTCVYLVTYIWEDMKISCKPTTENTCTQTNKRVYI